MKLLVTKNYLSFDLSLWLNCHIAAFHMQEMYDWQRRVLAQHSVATLLRHCLEWLQHCSNIETLCCAKNRRCQSSRVTLNDIRLFDLFQQKIYWSNGKSEKVVLFFRTKCSKRKFEYH